jgi:hypothetical protein
VAIDLLERVAQLGLVKAQGQGRYTIDPSRMGFERKGIAANVHAEKTKVGLKRQPVLKLCNIGGPCIIE